MVFPPEVSIDTCPQQISKTIFHKSVKVGKKWLCDIVVSRPIESKVDVHRLKPKLNVQACNMKLTWSKTFILTASKAFNEIYNVLVNVGKFLILLVFYPRV